MHYLGPTVGKLPLSTWEEIGSAAEGGLLEETQWCELKQQLPPLNKHNNIELAKDLASLSVDGGVLIFGIADKTFDVVGCDISGMIDRISQVAATAVHPPLSPVIYPAIMHPEQPEKAVLVVQVPPSPQAPHMVENSYWGRSSNGKRKLDDAEVRRLLHTRRNDEASFKDRLLSMVENDPVGPMVEGHPTGNGHIYLLAEPCTPIIGHTQDLNLQYAVHEVAETNQSRGCMGQLTHPVADPLGEALSFTGRSNTVSRQSEDLACYLLLNAEDNSLEFVSGAGTCYRENRQDSIGRGIEVVGTNAIAQTTLEFFNLISVLSLEYWAYTGQWHIGIHVTNLANKWLSFNDSYARGQTFPRDTFTNQTVTAPATWSDGAEPEARQLLTGYLRAVGIDNKPLNKINVQ